MALFIFITIFLDCFFYNLAGNVAGKSGLTITFSGISIPNSYVLYRVNDTLNLTCILSHTVFDESMEYDIDWLLPAKTGNSMNRMFKKPGDNNLTLIIPNLKEADSGEYKCIATPKKNDLMLGEAIVWINVKSRKKGCPESMFQCSPGLCIMKRYTCDGKVDCKQGEDESESNCGPGDPCHDKLRCEDGRCIPVTWCCDQDRDANCTTRIKHMCCQQFEKSVPFPRDSYEEDGSNVHYDNRLNEMNFLQTTVYTVIGCAMAFMFIVTILVIAICRVQMKRTLMSSPSNIRSNIGEQTHGLACCDFDVYVNGAPNQDLLSTNPLLVTYNINSGVQFIGKPIDPPPYCEIVASPPREGPPPPYASHENLTQLSQEPVAAQTVVEEDTEQTEDDALLGATGPSTNPPIITNTTTTPSAVLTKLVKTDSNLQVKNVKNLKFSSHNKSSHSSGESSQSSSKIVNNNNNHDESDVSESMSLS